MHACLQKGFEVGHKNTHYAKTLRYQNQEMVGLRWKWEHWVFIPDVPLSLLNPCTEYNHRYYEDQHQRHSPLLPIDLSPRVRRKP